MLQPYSNKTYPTHCDYTQSSFRFQYRLLTMTTFFEIAVDQIPRSYQALNILNLFDLNRLLLSRDDNPGGSTLG